MADMVEKYIDNWRKEQAALSDEQRRQAEVSWENLELRTQDHFTADKWTDAEMKKFVQGQHTLEPDTTTATVSGMDGVVFHVPKDFGSRRKELTMADLRRDCFPKEYTWWTRQPDDPPQEDKFRDLLSEVMPKKSESAICFDKEADLPSVLDDVSARIYYYAGNTLPKSYFEET